MQVGLLLGRGREEPSSFALKQNKTNTLNSSLRATGWGLDRDLRDLRSPLLLPSSLVLNFRYLEEGQRNYLVKEGKRIPGPCELEKTGVDV